MNNSIRFIEEEEGRGEIWADSLKEDDLLFTMPKKAALKGFRRGLQGHLVLGAKASI